MNKHSDDYIPYACEIEAAREEARARVKGKPDPRHKYSAKYKVNGTELNEVVMAFNAKEAEAHLRQQLSLVGWIPADLEIKSIDDDNA